LREADGGEAIQYFVGDEAVDVRAIEAAVVRFAKDKRPEVFRIQPKGQRVAVVGAGLAGLSAALNLAQKAYPVTVFEKGDKALWSWKDHAGHASFLQEIELQFSGVSAEFAFGKEIKGPDDPALTGFAYVHDATDNSGTDAIAAIAKGVGISQAIEAFLQTGRRQDEGSGLPENAAEPEKHYVDHRGEPRKAIVLPKDPESGYTKEEAMDEASRCMGCDCRACMDACIMLGKYNKRPQKIAIEAYGDTKSAPPFSACSLTRETYSCNLCGYCKSVCPVDVDLEKLFHIARAGRAETGRQPKAFHDFWLRDFEWHRGEGAYFAAEGPMIFFPGCKAGARAPSQIRDAAAFLKERYGAGILLDCCGAPAYWAGEDALFFEHMDSLREKWLAAGKPLFVFACAYCMRLFEEFLPEIEKASIYELLAIIENDGEFAAPANSPRTTYDVFDPCVAGGFPDMEQAVRKLASSLGIDLSELKERNQCCGYGGHMRVANPELYETIVEKRSAADEAPYLVYCANCAGAFSLSGKDHVHILDLVFPPEHEGRAPFPQGSLQQWRDNSARAKSAIAGLYGDTAMPTEKPWDAFQIEIPAPLALDMDKRLILEDDVREAVYKAESSGEIFAKENPGPVGGELRLCRIARGVVTIWAQYRAESPACAEDASAGPVAASYTVIDVWSHRMSFSAAERKGAEAR